MNIDFELIYILIPVLDPDKKLTALIKELTASGFCRILVVNDGSADKCSGIFEEVKNIPGCTVFVNYRNYGKGRALKNGMNHILSEHPGIKGIITVDGDGQHTVGDIVKCAQILSENADRNVLILGTRDFSRKDIPLRSTFGNKCTKHVLKLLCGISVSDTQTGLRGLSSSAASAFLDTAGERYEFEMNMIIETADKNVEIIQFPIETVYIDNNSSSHFNPLLDSFRIYSQFIKYTASSLASFAVDIFFFNVFINILGPIFPVYYIILSTYSARLISSVFNFTINRRKVFSGKSSVASSAVKYTVLCIIQAAISSIIVTCASDVFAVSITFIKIIADTMLFFISFYVQKVFVFRSHKR